MWERLHLEYLSIDVTSLGLDPFFVGETLGLMSSIQDIWSPWGAHVAP